VVEIEAGTIMKIGSTAGDAHLTYCTNIHRGETWADTRKALETYLPVVKSKVSPGKEMGVGLRLSNMASEELAAPGQMAAFKEFLRSNGLYVFTINGFPFGPFHGVRVKEEVYQPDWRFTERLAYSNRLADQLVEMLPADAGLDGSVSSVPATFRPIGTEAGAIDRIVENILQHASHLVGLAERTGRTITLALEPEPMCYLETSAELIRFLEDRIFSNSGVERFAAISGRAPAQAEQLLRRYVGICYDVCHAAVEFEHPSESIANLRRSGIGIFKLQLSAALKEPNVDKGTKDRLTRFDEGVYLHQVVQRKASGDLQRFLDLQPAFGRIDEAQGSEWRVHCHVPVFMDKLPELGTTQDFLRQILDLHKTNAISPHLEVETYTFDILPAELRQLDIASAVAREISWVQEQLGA
jgi:sugar phosphate isomerase/epimerase